MRKRDLLGKKINKIAEELESSGIKPTCELIREKLGDTGSYSTISSHLKKWRDSKSTASSTSHLSPASISLTKIDFEKIISDTLASQLTPYYKELSNRIEKLEKVVTSRDLDLAVLHAENEQLKIENASLIKHLTKREEQLRECIKRFKSSHHPKTENDDQLTSGLRESA